MLYIDICMLERLKESDYFNTQTEMHYAFLGSASSIRKEAHTHEFFELFLLTDGRICHSVNGRDITLTEGALTFIRPDDVHRFKAANNQDCQLINLAIASRAVTDLFVYLGEGIRPTRILDTRLPPVINLNRDAKERLQGRLERLNTIPPERPDEKRSALRLLLFDMLSRYLQPASEETEANLPVWLSKVCDQMQSPKNLQLGVPRMLELSGVSAEHLSRSVRKHLDQTPTSYVNGLRLTYAANLLSHSDTSIIGVAAEAGFESLSYFYKLFRERYAQTPRSFRRGRKVRLPHTPD